MRPGSLAGQVRKFFRIKQAWPVSGWRPAFLGSYLVGNPVKVAVALRLRGDARIQSPPPRVARRSSVGQGHNVLSGAWRVTPFHPAGAALLPGTRKAPSGSGTGFQAGFFPHLTAHQPAEAVLAE